MLNLFKTETGNTLVMTLALMLVFATLSVSLSQLIESQSLAVEMITAQSKTDYAAYSGLIHADTIITQDISTTIQDPLKFDYRKRYCVAWISVEGFLRCNEQASPSSPCCQRSNSGFGCQLGNDKGTCLENTQWSATYSARYDSLRKSIISSGSIQLQYLNPDTPSSGNALSFGRTKEMLLDWE